MSGPLSAESIIVNLSKQIELEWIAGREVPKLPLHQVKASQHATLIGHLNLVHKNLIQVIGKTECKYLLGLEVNFRDDMLREIFSVQPVAIIMADGIPVPDMLIDHANVYHTPLLSCKTESNKVVEIARFYLHNKFSKKEVIHGVFMEVLGTGVLITGQSSIGKSELALALISRGHRLIADDAPEFTRIGPGILDGKSPGALKDFIEVRGLGVLNIREMYGDNALKRNKYLRLIVHLQRLSEKEYAQLDRLCGVRDLRTILGIEIPQVLIPIEPGRNLEVLVEAAVRNHILRFTGNDATEQFINLQQQAINNPSL
ncbi:MAG: HPr(Ser) kinase/phosphatase [Gammaproteobacteria bacterium]|nr:HPr(Ser) kinase/phosphatase [Gammaproteobacteria bacterium]